MATNSRILSLNGQGLHLDTRADVEPLLKDIDPTIVEEIHLGGNTIGIEAAQALAEFIEKTQVLRVRRFTRSCFPYSNSTLAPPFSLPRSLTLPTSSPAA